MKLKHVTRVHLGNLPRGTYVSFKSVGGREAGANAGLVDLPEDILKGR
jgi:hypothetical protein